eukprot:5572963-Pleurochrysis_carterae.AAC.2
MAQRHWSMRAEDEMARRSMDLREPAREIARVWQCRREENESHLRRANHASIHAGNDGACT